MCDSRKSFKVELFLVEYLNELNWLSSNYSSGCFPVRDYSVWLRYCLADYSCFCLLILTSTSWDCVEHLCTMETSAVTIITALTSTLSLYRFFPSRFALTRLSLGTENCVTSKALVRRHIIWLCNIKEFRICHLCVCSEIKTQKFVSRRVVCGYWWRGGMKSFFATGFGFPLFSWWSNNVTRRTQTFYGIMKCW